jgi:hypothetical protein
MTKVQGFWEGDLGTMENMCIKSYLRKGHVFHLYAYDWFKLTPSKPENLEIHDAEEILPREKMSLFPSPSIFSDFFRYALLAKRGGWWVDMDTICLQPFGTLDDEYVFASDNIDQYYISGCFMKAPQIAPIMVNAYEYIYGLTKEKREALGHMDIGPYLLQREVPRLGLGKYVQGPLVFDPIPWNKITEIVDSSKTFDLSQSYAIHLRQSIWDEGPNSCAGILPNGKKLMIDETYPEDSLWEKLKRDLL